MKIKKSFYSILAALLLVVMNSVTVNAAIKGNSYYSYDCYDGTPGNRGAAISGRISMLGTESYPRVFFREGETRPVSDTWINMDVFFDGKYSYNAWYYYGEGSLVIDKLIEVDGYKYYMTERGAVSGWYGMQYFDPTYHYMWTSGNVERYGQMYTIGSDGVAMPYSELGYSGDLVTGGDNTGWTEVDGQRYFLRNGECIKREWLQDGDIWYYLDINGYPSIGIHMIDGELYKFDKSGHMITYDTDFYQKKKYTFGADGKGVLTDMTTDEKIRQSDVVKWMAETYAIYSREALIEELFGDGYDIKELLIRDWGIEGRDDGIAQINALANTSASDKNTKAWDYSRAMLLCDSLARAGYITNEEKVNMQLTIAPRIQSSFYSWQDFNDSYMNAYHSWANANGREDNISGRDQLYNLLLDENSDTFTLPWYLDLVCDWQ